MKTTFYLAVISLLLTNVAVHAQFNTSGGNTTTNDNVGIGTNSPQAGIHIATAANQWTSYNIGTNLILQGSRHNAIGVFDFSGSNPWAIVNRSGNFEFAKMPSLGDVITNPDIKLTIKQSGYIGIGDYDPDQKLVVNGNIKSILDLNLPKKNVAALMSLGYSGITGAQNWTIRGVYQHVNGVGLNADGGDLDIIKSYDGNTVLATKTDGTALGNVGIGTLNTRGFRLAVNGSIRAQEIKVEASPWPDYVFQSSYHLPTLAQVKTYIRKNHHLPDMPSNTEVAKDGVNLGEIVKLQTKKIEELTLYLIEQNKQLRSQQRQLGRLKSIVRKLQR